jgi:hypothetical protein
MQDPNILVCFETKSARPMNPRLDRIRDVLRQLSRRSLHEHLKLNKTSGIARFFTSDLQVFARFSSIFRSARASLTLGPDLIAAQARKLGEMFHMQPGLFL